MIIHLKGEQMKNTIITALSFSFLLASCSQINNEGVGTIGGGVVGGLLGSQFGGGSGKVAAAAGGALIGAMLGEELANIWTDKIAWKCNGL